MGSENNTIARCRFFSLPEHPRFAVLIGYVNQEHSLYELEDGTVALKCDKKREAEGFPDVDPHFEGTLKLNQLCHALPVHAIWGTRADLVFASVMIDHIHIARF